MKFTLNEFFEQVLYFRDLMGSKSFWVKPEDFRKKAVSGLTFIYTNTKTDTPKDEETLVNVYTATINEYNYRESMAFVSELLGLT